MSRLCPKCGKPYSGASCPRCKRQLGHGKRTREQEAARKAQNPWRSEYGSQEYRKARQSALSATGGRCALCGRVVAEFVGRWRMLPGAGGVHHIRALSSGGGNDAGNLAPLCSSCHNRVDAERRRLGL